MRLRRISIERMPGVSQIDATDIGPGITVITGPNESGKTSLVRAVRALLWGIEPAAGTQPVDVAAELELAAGEPRRVWREGGRTRWQRGTADTEPPPLPDVAYAGCFTIELDQLATSGGDDTSRRLARELAAELTGGIDVAAARAQLDAQVPTGRSELREVRERQRAYTAVHSEQRNLADQFARLDQLRSDLAALDAQRARAHELQQAAVVVQARTRLAALDAELAALPVHRLEQTQADDREQHTRLVSRLAVARERLTADTAALTAAEATLRDLTGADNISAQLLGELRELVTQLVTAEQSAATAATAAAAARAKAEAAARALGGDAADVASTELVDVPASALEEARKVAVERSKIELARTELELRRSELTQAPASTPDRDPGPAHPRSAARLPLLLVLVAALVAIVIAVTQSPIAWVLVALVVVLGIVLWRAQGASTPQAASSSDDVVRRDAVRAEIEAQLARVEQRDATVTEFAARFLETYGIETGTGDGAITEVLSRMAHARDTELDAVATQEAAAREAARVTVTLERIATVVAPLDGDAPVDAASARSLLDALDARARDFSAARERVATLTTTRDDRAADVTDITTELTAFRVARGCTPERDDDAAVTAELTALWAQRPEWLRLTEQRTEQGGIERDALARVPERAREELLTRSVEELESELVECRDASTRHDDVLRTVNALEASVEAASSATTVTDALLAVESATDDLVASRDEALRVATAAFLLDAAATEFEHTATPRIMSEANEFLHLATAGRYALAIDDDQQIAARDLVQMHQPIRQLGALSGGTRAQLLIAARLAFARSAELGEALPVFIDEALTTTDPERFDAVFRALAAIAQADGRQFLYLTSNTADAGHVDAVLERAGFAPAQHVTIGAAPVTPPHALPERAQIVAPGAGETPEAYAARLGVPALDLHADASSVHVWHLLEPRLDLVHRLVDANVTRVGQLRTLAAQGLLGSSVTEQDVPVVDAALRAWDAFVPAWRQGRARPFTHRNDLRAVFADAGVAADRWFDEIWELAVAADRDPVRLIAALRAGGAKGLRTAKVDDLEHALRSASFLPTDEVLDDVVIEALVRAAAPEQPDRATRWLGRGTPAPV